MKKFLTLLEIEFRGILGIIIGFFGAVTVLSMLAFWGSSASANTWASRMIIQNGMTVAEYVEQNGYFTLTRIMELHYAIFIFLFFGVIGAISLWIWNCEWAGKSKGIYFLLTLKGSRLRILATKTVAIIVTSWLYYGLIIVNLLIGEFMMNIIFTDGLVGNNLVAQYFRYATQPLNIIAPDSLGSFVQMTLFTVAIFLTMTVWILLIKSFRLRGGLVGFVYSTGVLAVYIYTHFVLWLFADERILVEWGFLFGVVGLGLGLSWWLLNKKISV